jgi:hypothetical protein
MLKELAGAKATVNVHVKLTGTKPAPRGAGAKRRGAPETQLERRLKTLRKEEARVLDWLEADPSHAAELLADPVAALRKSGVNMDAATVSALSSSAQRTKLPGGVRLGTVTAEVDRGTR